MQDGVIQIPGPIWPKKASSYAAVAAAIKDWITARDGGEGTDSAGMSGPAVLRAIAFKYA